MLFYSIVTFKNIYLIFSLVLGLLGFLLHVLSSLFPVHSLRVDLGLLDVSLKLFDLDHLLLLLRVLLKLGQLQRLSSILGLLELLL